MKQPNEDLAENKVLILYLLNKLSDGIKSDNLYKIVSSTNNINYFYYQELITDKDYNFKLFIEYTYDEIKLYKDIKDIYHVDNLNDCDKVIVRYFKILDKFN